MTESVIRLHLYFDFKTRFIDEILCCGKDVLEHVSSYCRKYSNSRFLANKRFDLAWSRGTETCLISSQLSLQLCLQLIVLRNYAFAQTDKFREKWSSQNFLSEWSIWIQIWRFLALQILIQWAYRYWHDIWPLKDPPRRKICNLLNSNKSIFPLKFFDRVWDGGGGKVLN